MQLEWIDWVIVVVSIAVCFVPALFFGTPIDCWTAVKWPSSTFEPGCFCASLRSPGFRPASAR